MHSNPLRWKCEQLGCYNALARPKIEVFAECFPGRICMGDIDGLVEMNGRFLLMEWKREPREIPKGQAITYDMLLRTKVCTVICIAGCAETMSVTHAMRFRPGCRWRPSSLDSCKRFMSAWAKWASKQPRPA